ncbi:MAG: 2-C-methyl-D-erythritol 4-phosphate cytidylyltransferase [Thermodesulfobacteriota bacterium]|nr:2-C-methyl-D-erythritol 4-phosphate cytidylyltransferase [Thermodesulfobacteriota bacterium]
MRVIALIAAAGVGKRMGIESNKLLINLQGIPILVRTLIKFEQHCLVDEIFILANPKDLTSCKSDIVDRYGITKVTKIIPGGTKRQDSIKNGLDEVREDCIVLIHDGARPFISGEVLNCTIQETRTYGATAVCIPATDTVKLVTDNTFIEKTKERERVFLAQTPQAFRYEIIKEAYKRAYADGYYATDDATLVERLGTKVKVIPGSSTNIKITTKEDLKLAAAILLLEGKNGYENRNRL